MIWQNKAMIILLALLAAILVISYPSQKIASGGPALVGIVREPLAYCTFTEINNNDPRFSISIADGYPGLINALKNGQLDASILPVQYLKELNGNEFSAVAGTSYLNLVVIENGNSVFSLADLNGRTSIMPESAKNSLEFQMLNLLISKANIDVTITYQNDEAIQKLAWESNFEIMILPPDQSAAVLMQNENYRSCFNLASQWYSLQGTQPPAGCLIVARNASIDAKSSNLAGFLASVKASVEFINSKHKKAASLITTSGLGDNSAYILKVVPHCAFAYIQGDSMADSLEQLKLLPAI